MISDGPGDSEYRNSHSSKNYGQHYEKTYQTGYYRDQWELIERPLLESLLVGLKASGADECLDFACGTGRVTRVAERIFPRVVGVDVSSTMLAQARSKCVSSDFIEQDITSRPLQQQFDVITAFRFFLNAQPELRRSALQALNQCLHDDGRLVLNIHVNSSSVLGLAYRLRNFLSGRVIANTCSVAEIEAYLHEAGFEIESSEWYSYLPRIGWRYPGAYRRMMSPVERFCTRSSLIPRGLAQSFILVAKKGDSS